MCTLKKIKFLQADTEQSNLLVTNNVKQVVQNDIYSLNQGTYFASVKMKKCLSLSDNFNGSKNPGECEMKSENDNSVKTFETSNDDSDNSNKLYISCRFCREGFETIEYFNAHNCKNKKNNSSFKVHKCKFCSLTFTQKHHLNRHVLGHKKNNCTICSAQFAKRKGLCKHLRTEHNIVEPLKVHHCSFCSKQFSVRRSLNLHLKSHANDQYLCLKCGFMFDNEDTYKDHVKEHSKNPNHECHLCGKKFVRRQQYDQHMMGHEKYSCSPCNVTFSTKKLFLKHQQSVHHIRIEKKYACPICKKLFFRPKLLQLHQRSHTGEKPVKCSHCEKHFSDDISLSKHMKTVRHLQRVNIDEGKVIEIEKPYLCSGCGARFHLQQSLLRHIESRHSASESLKCPHCVYNTKCKANLKRHIELHTDTKRFICEICGLSFRAFATLKEHHVFVHSENRGFICDICNKGFKSKSDLQRHVRIHSKSRPYKCHCSRDYKRLSHLKRHMVSAHHMTFKTNQVPIIKESTNLDVSLNNENVTALEKSLEELPDVSLNNENVTALVKSLEELPDQSSCDDFSVSTAANSNAVYTELNDSNINENSCEEKLPVQAEDENNYIDVPLNIKQILEKSDVYIMSDDQKSILISYVSIPSEKTDPSFILPDTEPSSISLDDTNLNLSPTSYCNFNLPSSPFSSISVENATPTLQNSITSQDVLSFSSSDDSLIRPHSLPNLNFHTHASTIDSYAHFSLHDSDSSSSMQIPPFLLSSDISSPSHVTDLNLEQNSSPKQLFGDSDDILSLPPYTPSNELDESNCSSENFFNPTRDMELWDAVDSSNILKVSSNDLVTSTCANSNFSTGLTCTANNLLPHNLFSNDSLAVCSLDASPLKSEFDELSNLC